MRATLVVLIVVAMLHRPEVAAQAGCSFDTSTRVGIPDTLLIAFTPGPRIGFKPELEADYLDAAEAIRQYYRTPQSITVPIWARLSGDSARTGFGASDDARHGFDGEVRFRLDSLGHLATDSIAVETLNDDLAISVAAAIRRADSASAFAPPSTRLLEDRGIVRLHFITPRPGSAPATPFLRVIVPTIRLDRPPDMQSLPPIAYPLDLRSARVPGRVTLQFVIGTDGRPVQPSVSVVQADYRDFAIAALSGVSGMRFKPARIGDCDVPVLVRQPIDFKVR